MFKPLALAAAFLASAPAFAAVSIKYVNKDAGDAVIATSAGTNYATGAMNYIDAAGNSFQAYCVEPTQIFAAASKGFKTYTVGSFTSGQASLLEALYSSSFQSVSSGSQQAAFQLAVWEIVSEDLTNKTASTLNVTSGSFSLTSTDATSLAVAALAAQYLTAAQSYTGASLYSLTKLTNVTYQDLVVATRITTAVPEPESYALFLAGLGAIGMIARRRLPR